MSPRISCIIPVWNGERFLGQALDSVFAQSLPPDEVIVVDDGSTDGSADIVLGRCEQIQLIRQAKGGAASARNTGVRVATGNLFAFIDADDLWLPAKVQRQLETLYSAPASGCCVTLIDTFLEDSLCADAGPTSLNQPKVGHIASALMVWREAWARIGPMDESMQIRAEFDWFARISRAAIGIVTVPEILARRRLHRDNISRRFTAASIDAAFDTIQRHRGRGVL